MNDERNIPWSAFVAESLQPPSTRAIPAHIESVMLGRVATRVEFFEEGICRILTPAPVSNFYSTDHLTPLELKDFQRMRRGLIHKLIHAIETMEPRQTHGVHMGLKEHLSIDAYPLYWPEGQPRIPRYSREPSRFKNSFAMAHELLIAEVHRLQGTNPRRDNHLNPIISTNILLRRDGLPLANQRAPDDPGVAVYFERNNKPLCIACDRFVTVDANMRAISKTIDAFRGIERWGASSMLDRAFSGFEALPPPPGMQPWWEILGVHPHCSRAEVEHGWRRIRSATHPDNGGSTEAFQRATKAYEMALRRFQ